MNMTILLALLLALAGIYGLKTALKRRLLRAGRTGEAGPRA